MLVCVAVLALAEWVTTKIALNNVFAKLREIHDSYQFKFYCIRILLGMRMHRQLHAYANSNSITLI